MKKLLVLLLLIPVFAVSQVESHNFVRIDTTFTLGSNTWHMFMERPVNMFTAGNSDTASRPCIFFMSGQGEQGRTDTGALNTYGPFYWRNNGWDGGVTLGNGKHYPILVSLIYENNNVPNPSALYPALVYLQTTYHIKTPYRGYQNSFHGTGLSQGSFTQGGEIEYEGTLGDHAGMKMYGSLCMLEGTPTSPSTEFPPRAQNCSTAWCDTNYYNTWDTLYHGRYFYLEGSGSDNERDGWHYSGAMNNVAPGTAYFSYESLGGGAHCCWNSMYDPSVTNWSSVSPLGPNNSPSQAGTNQMGNYTVPCNLFTWMFKQGDTAMVNSSASLIVSAGPDQTLHIPVNGTVLTGSATPPSGFTISSYFWNQVSGTAAVIGSPTTAITAINSLSLGSNSFRLRVIDSRADTVYDTVAITEAAHIPTTYHWPTSNAAVVITPELYPTLYAGDSILVGGYLPGGGYFGWGIDTSGYMNMPGDIVLQFTDSAYISHFTSTRQFNQTDSANHFKIRGLRDENNPDPLLFTIGKHAHSHFITLDSCFIGFNGGFCQVVPIGLPKFNGSLNDTVNCWYYWHFHKVTFHDIGNSISGGITALIFGNMDSSNMAAHLTVDSCTFINFPNPTSGGGAINIANCFNCVAEHNSFSNLGVVAFPGSHAAVFGVRSSLVYIRYNFFNGNFGNCVRTAGTGSIPSWASRFTAWDATYDGVSRIYGNIDDSSRKYPFLQASRGDADSAVIGYYRCRRSPHVWNNTGWKLAAGALHPAYNPSMYDWLGIPGFADTLELHNTTSAESAFDTVCTVCNAQMCNQLITTSNGTPVFDTSGNYFLQCSTFANSGFADTTQFHILYQGPLYNKGVSVPAYITKDFYGSSIPITGRVPFGLNTGVDIGAVQYIGPIFNNRLTFPRKTLIH